MYAFFPAPGVGPDAFLWLFVFLSYDDWIQDIEPGDVVDHELVPVVYP
jgi:hypothetical protein